jgi:hypothetical protein
VGNKPEVVKFKMEHEYRCLSDEDISQFGKCKPSLLKKNLIGTLKKGEYKGYDCGNMSVRIMNGKELNVLITGTQTSGKPDVVLDDFALILDYSPNLFLVKSYGMVKPSSETPLHWSVYEACSDVKAIIHAHIFEYDPLYEYAARFFKERELPLTLKPGGTIEIGLEIKNLVKKVGYKKIIGMLNHNGGFGLLSMGKDMKEACSKLIRLREELSLYIGDSR